MDRRRRTKVRSTCVESELPSCPGLRRLGRNVLALGGGQLKGSVEGPCRQGGRLVYPRHVHWAVERLGMRWSLRGLGQNARVPGCRPVDLSFCSGFSLARTRQSCCQSGTSHNTWRIRARLVGPRARSGTCPLVRRHHPSSLLWR